MLWTIQYIVPTGPISSTGEVMMLVGAISTLVGLLALLVRYVIKQHKYTRVLHEDIQDVKTDYTEKLLKSYQDNSEKLIEVISGNKDAIRDIKLSVDRNTDALGSFRDVITPLIILATKNKELK